MIKKKKDIKKIKKKTGGRKVKKRIDKPIGDVLRLAVMAAFEENHTKLFNYRQISGRLGMETVEDRHLVADLLASLAKEGVLAEPEEGRYRYNVRSLSFEGIFDRRNNGRHFVNPVDGAAPVPVDEVNSGHALQGDKVLVQLLAKRRGQKERQGQVVEILERADSTFVGRLDLHDNFAFLNVESRDLGMDIFIPGDKVNNARNGDKVIVRINEWPESSRSPIGEVMVVLGEAGDNDVEMNAILAEYGLPYIYPEAVEKAADALSGEITEAELRVREDFRGVLTFTIDPADAKDFDDALSYRKLSADTYEVGVHIADVSHFVTPGDIIDEEAYKRATSIYLVDRTVPMLPERLCNELCSLRPDEDKYAYSVVFKINEEARVQDYRIVKSVIRSSRRFSYEEAQEVIETGRGECQEAILKLNDLAQKLRESRFSKGGIAFDREEVRFTLDEKGKPLGVYIKESKEANKLIEEFMLLANKTVASHIGNPGGNPAKAKTFVYRVHEQPEPGKLGDLSDFVSKFGLKLKTQGSNMEVGRSINRLLESVKGRPEENLVQTVAIRSMPKAYYSTENFGHYGLAFDYYTHFTSPIRRYPDLMVHRLLTRYMLEGGPSVSRNEYEGKCQHSSDMEQLAANAERSSIKYKQVEFMSEHLGKVFDGVVSGVTEWGLYVELSQSKCEGLVPIRMLDDDYYEYDEKGYCLIGRRTRRKYRLGDAITVRVAQANLERKQLDFDLA
ncbi:ribonuclease R [Porphyromonas macacae]|uniref:ribonuclease R n=1 Tax=Porphyromonas macacae TaxID=28115 RepID=UPI00052D99E8|nr:ribonuclease R [Porphyromonas macacae]KGN99524.1 ribonuclease R [Porphyromonas macacae]